ncbi:CAP domain-containing protein [Scenedesmus sp. NREL 46B-D3]|nr:CAP domain-containing protein [Scenedesmus sp. NREL 46B-D3]
MKWLVDKHNELRARHGVQPMVWDWGLAWNAYNYVLNCPNGHSGKPGIGENLAWGHNDFNHAMRDWYDEIKFYNFNRPSFAENTGHFTTMVWKDSNRIGCAANMRCRFKTWICQFTPPGNFVLAGGGVDFALWTSQVLAPAPQFMTGTKPDGSPSYASYDPTGDSTRGLPAPAYGELKNFGYAPKPGKSIIMYDWQRYVPTSVLIKHIPAPVLAQYLDNDTMALLAPEAKTHRTLVGWQRAIPARVIQQYVPEELLALYVPEGVVMATTGPTDSPLSTSAQHQSTGSGGDDHSKPTAAAAAPAAAGTPSTAAPAPVTSTAVPAPVTSTDMTVAAVLKPRSGLAGLIDDLTVARPTTQQQQQQQQPLPTTAYIVPVQQVQPASVDQGQQQQQQMMMLVQQPGGGAAYYMPVAAVQKPVSPISQQQVAVVTVQPQPQQVLLAPANTAFVPVPATGSMQGPAAVPADSNFQQGISAPLGVADAGVYSGYGPAVGRSAPTVVAAAAGPPSDMQQALDRHNTYRRRHQAAPLLWDAKMAAQAAEFAASCPMGRSGRARLGENLAFGFSDVPSAVDTWYAQASAYNFAAPSFYPAAAQFSQLVWAGSQKVGCAVAPGCSMPTLVCNYYPAGNVIGREWSLNVRAPAAAVGATPPASANAVAAVGKPSKPAPGVAKAFYARLGQPVTNDGAPISRSSPPQQYATAAVLSPELQAAVDRHNSLRAKHGAPALQWDTAIAVTAQSWAAGCPNGHSGQRGVGENMAWGYASLADAVQAWFDEVKLYDFARPGWSASTGHFTQVVWLSTTRLGCAINTACSWPTYACQYGVPGNVLGTDWSKQVLRPGTAPPPGAATPTGGAPTTAAPAPASPKDAELLAALTVLNAFRQSHQAAPLAWDERLEASAKAWAATCQFAVSGTPGVGEGLGFGYGSLPQAIKDWYGQVSVYNFTNPGWSSKSGLFSQMVWRDTRAVGCAFNKACPWAMFVCHYSPPGNMVGPGIDWSKQVLPAIFGQPQGPSVPALAGALAKTNALRARHQAAALTWDGELAAQAADHLADCPKTSSAARRSYNFSSPGFSLLAGHFSQLVWRGTTRMGCAVNAGCDWETYSCLYHPPGNDVAADWSQQVMPDIKLAGNNGAVTGGRYATWAPAVPTATDAAGGSGAAGAGSSSMPSGVAGGSLIVPDAWTNQQQQQGEATPEEQPVPAQQQGDAGNAAADPWALRPGTPVPTMPAAQFFAPPAVMPAPATATPPAAATPDYSTPALPAAPAGAPLMTAGPMPQPASTPAAAMTANPTTDAPMTAVPVVPALVTAAPAAAADPSVPAEYASVLAATNAHRARHQAPAAAWDAALAARAQAFASGCPSGHSGDRGVGENMAWGYQSWKAAVDGWYNEVSSHFTQLVWKDTTKMGCGLNTSCGMATYVCQYAPAGNVMGIDWSNQVMPAQQ